MHFVLAFAVWPLVEGLILAFALLLISITSLRMYRAKGRHVAAPSDQVKQLVGQGKTIEAIKRYRGESGATLSEATHMVSSLQSAQPKP